MNERSPMGYIEFAWIHCLFCTGYHYHRSALDTARERNQKAGSKIYKVIAWDSHFRVVKAVS
jgi:hypothetical protein